MNKEVFAVDLDDCCVPFDINFRGWMGVKYRIELLDKDKVEGKFKYHEAFPNCGVNSEGFTKYIGEYTLTEGMKIVPYEDVLSGLSELSNWFDLHIVTARPSEHREATEQLIDDQGFSSIISELHTVGDVIKSKHPSKVDTYRKIGATHTVDDGDHNINDAIGAGLVGYSMQRPDHTHNGHNLHESAIVVASFADIVKHQRIQRAANLHV